MSGLPNSNSAKYAPSSAPLSSETLSDILSGKPIDLHRMRVVFPDRWSAFLKAHFRDSTQVAYFMGVNERTARLWMEGTTAPRAEVVLSIISRCPAVLPILLGDAA